MRKATLVIIMFLLLIFSMFLPLVQATPFPIFGRAQKSGGGSADGAYVKVTSSLGTIHTYVGSAGGWESGYWMIDVGSPGPNWSNGTSFEVVIRLNGTQWYSSTESGTVSGTTVNMGTITLTDHSTSGGGGGGGAPPANNPPTADPGGPYSYIANSSILFDGSSSTDDDGEITNYTWSFGDGEVGYGAVLYHSYSNPGNYTVSLTVTDTGGATDTQSTYVIITGEPEGVAPVAVITSSSEAVVDEIVTFSASQSTDSDGHIVNYTWIFEDGTIKYGRVVNHVFTSPDTYVVILTVTDDGEKTDTTLKSITILQGTSIEITDGYVIDTDGDGEPDDFYDSETGRSTKMEKQDDGTYLIDVDNDGVWDYVYNPASGAVVAYQPTEEIDEGIPLWVIAAIIIAVILMLIGFLFYSGILYFE